MINNLKGPATPRKVMFILTQTRFAEGIAALRAAGNRARAAGIRLYLIGIGNYDKAQFLALAGNNRGYVFGYSLRLSALSLMSLQLSLLRCKYILK